MASYLIEKDLLTGEYRQVFERVESYAMLEGVGQNAQDEMLANLLDLLYTAQTEGKPATKITGPDVERFCRDYFAEQTGLDGWSRDMPTGFYRLAWVMLVFCLIDIWTMEDGTTFWTAQTEIAGLLAGLIAGALVSFASMGFSRRFLFQLKRISAAVLSWVILGISVAVVVLIVLLTDRFGWTFELPLAALTLICAGYVVIYKAVQLGLRYRKTGSFKKDTSGESFLQLINDSVDQEMPKALSQKYRKECEKRSRKGEENRTYGEFLEAERRTRHRMNRVLLILYTVIWGVETVFIGVTNAQEGIPLWDTLIFAAVCGAILALVYRIFYCSKKGFRRLDYCAKVGLVEE
ncbi:MAG: DUF1048 domain-containing protein [Lachnospiraceae bacterium]|nr:DUF1048 domain-containing protein [Lachnospiraceae bacterium]